MSLGAEEVLTRLFDSQILDEIQALLWGSPHVNRGVFDGGWNCRDHAWLMATLLTEQGHDNSVVHGQATFVATTNGKTAGLGSSGRAGEHTWIERLEGQVCDFSPNLAITQGAWAPVAWQGAVDGNWLPDGGGEIRWFDVAEEWHTALPQGKHEVFDQPVGMYLARRRNVLRRSDVLYPFRTIYSPLTIELARSLPDTVYHQLVLYISRLMGGSHRDLELRLLPQEARWSALRSSVDRDSARAHIRSLAESLPDGPPRRWRES